MGGATYSPIKIPYIPPKSGPGEPISWENGTPQNGAQQINLDRWL
jgi:hypothetical protein